MQGRVCVCVRVCVCMCVCACVCSRSKGISAGPKFLHAGASKPYTAFLGCARRSGKPLSTAETQTRLIKTQRFPGNRRETLWKPKDLGGGSVDTRAPGLRPRPRALTSATNQNRGPKTQTPSKNQPAPPTNHPQQPSSNTTQPRTKPTSTENHPAQGPGSLPGRFQAQTAQTCNRGSSACPRLLHAGDSLPYTAIFGCAGRSGKSFSLRRRRKGYGILVETLWKPGSRRKPEGNLVETQGSRRRAR